VFGQYLEDRPFSRQVGFIIFGGMLLFATGITIYDLLARRQHRRRRDQQRGSA
jgi:hypothetical protein